MSYLALVVLVIKDGMVRLYFKTFDFNNFTSKTSID